MTIGSNEIYFFVSYGVALLVCGLIAKWYLWPVIAHREPKAALTPLLFYA
jgi:hypothetical protein